MPASFSLRPLIPIVLLALLSACAGSPPPAQRSTQVPASTYLTGPACIIDLSYRGVAFNRLPDTAQSGACGVSTAISLTEVPFALDKPVTVDCSLARQVSLWEENVVRPAVRQHFQQDLKKIFHYGGYNCRGRTSNRSRLSEHAFGKAIDIAGFELANGTRISVEKDWSAGGSKGAFLRDVARGACGMFSVVLTPNSDKDHENHLHLDIGPWKLCSL
ncbi:extensin-like domain-containing protein [Insolitispirillum peregrinum]|uniref:extensin-like domain-containing protein n=1 Tax=Insolitispirillum peregrinum TaxID=80876 RepID=UPI00361942DE